MFHMIFSATRRKPSGKLSIVLACVIALVLLFTALPTGCSSSESPDSRLISDRPRDFTPTIIPANAIGSENLIGVQWVGDGDFEAKVLKSDILVLVHFWAEWAGPCRQVTQALEMLSSKYEGKVKFFQLDVDTNPRKPQTYGVSAVPTLLIFKNGKVADKMVGAVPSSKIEDFINRNLPAPPTTTTIPTTTSTTTTPSTTISPSTTTRTPVAQPVIYRAFPKSYSQALDQTDILSEIKLFACNFAPNKYMTCDGSQLAISGNQSLFNIIGNKYGGDGRTNFALPNLAKNNPLSSQGGQGYVICVNGQQPPDNSSPASTEIRYNPQPAVAFTDYYTSEIVLAKNINPDEIPWLTPCDGKLLSISAYTATFALIGTNYGGNGVTVFAIPNLSSVKSPVEGAQYYFVMSGKFPPRQ